MYFYPLECISKENKVDNEYLYFRNILCNHMKFDVKIQSVSGK